MGFASRSALVQPFVVVVLCVLLLAHQSVGKAAEVLRCIVVHRHLSLRPVPVALWYGLGLPVLVSPKVMTSLSAPAVAVLSILMIQPWSAWQAARCCSLALSCSSVMEPIPLIAWSVFPFSAARCSAMIDLISSRFQVELTASPHRVASESSSVLFMCHIYVGLRGHGRLLHVHLRYGRSL